MNLKLESLRNWWENNFFKDYILNLIFKKRSLKQVKLIYVLLFSSF